MRIRIRNTGNKPLGPKFYRYRFYKIMRIHARLRDKKNKCDAVMFTESAVTKFPLALYRLKTCILNFTLIPI